MVDYAQQRVLSKQRVEVGERAANGVVVGVSFFGFAVALVIGLLIYFAGYQNMRMAYIKHSINQKKTELATLSTRAATLEAERARLLSSHSILSQTDGLKIARDVQIVY